MKVLPGGKNLNRAIITLSMLLLGACGFQLRGSGPAALSLPPVAVAAPAGLAETRDAFVRSLRERDIVVAADASASEVLVEILDERNYRRPVSTTRTLDAAEYELRLEVDIAVSSSGKVLTPLATLASERIYSVDPVNLSGSYEERRMLQAEMRRELARMMLRRVQALRRAGQPP